MSGYSFNQIQDFNNILQGNPIVISIIKNIVHFWKSNKKMWFSHEEVVYFPTVQLIYEDCKNINIALLIQYDQIFRHPCKLIKDEDRPKAFDFATKLAFKMIQNGQYSEMDDCEKVFTLLSIRHNNNLTFKQIALNMAFEQLNNKGVINKNIWIRFINASIIDIDKLKSSIGYKKELLPEIDTIIDLNDLRVRFKDILEEPTKVDPSFNFMKTQDILKANVERIIKSTKNTKKIAVSISGGVDSMVLSYISTIVAKNLNKQIILIHIKYNNRDCCHREIELLRYWASYLQVDLYIRDINEIQRSRETRIRTMYEDVTRDIRFSFYKYFNCPVMLGHNRDDTFENMFSNLSKGIHFDNLAGMKEIGQENNVTILRPFLSTNKIDLISFADKLNMPHLYDSTPAWSNRGKTRDSLIPAINKFDTNILDGLERFSQYTSFLYNQWEQKFDEWNQINIEMHSGNIIIYRDGYFDTNYENISFWRRIWFKNHLNDCPSGKSFMNLIENIKRGKVNKCNMNKYYTCKVNIDKIVIIRNS